MILSRVGNPFASISLMRNKSNHGKCFFLFFFFEESWLHADFCHFQVHVQPFLLALMAFYYSTKLHYLKHITHKDSDIFTRDQCAMVYLNVYMYIQNSICTLIWSVRCAWIGFGATQCWVRPMKKNWLISCDAFGQSPSHNFSPRG